MQTFSDLKALPDTAKGALVAIGNFDGVHRGHQILLARAREKAQELGKTFAVLTFEPHPRALFRPDDPPFRITPADLKAERLDAAGVEYLYSVRFDWDFASLSAEDFIQKILKDELGAGHIVVGYDFCFGQLRKGTPAMIKEAGLPVTIVEKVLCEGGQDAYSSSRIRQALRHGKIKEANDLLGWPWEVRGPVVRGDRRGRELGYPTANVHLEDTVHPGYGVYASLARLEGEEQWRPSATNIGIRPMFEVPVAQVETFIFDFDKEIYDRTLRVRPVQRLRGEAKFNSLDDLIAQMEKDCAEAKKVLG